MVGRWTLLDDESLIIPTEFIFDNEDRRLSLSLPWEPRNLVVRNLIVRNLVKITQTKHFKKWVPQKIIDSCINTLLRVWSRLVSSMYKSLVIFFCHRLLKGTVMQIKKTLLNGLLRLKSILKVLHSKYF